MRAVTIGEVAQRVPGAPLPSGLSRSDLPFPPAPRHHRARGIQDAVPEVPSAHMDHCVPHGRH